ncbi:TonB-dependent receptor [Parasphingopyxis algicola]|uniref:TonB-dependent receptor n=1 Tax=Parasphingopyxis algicola TaxID=2026624 RepID=UPI0015A4A9E3|nr:TonB-dependent receptor [Parasphingopyxis algicola]QLC23996.1 TonB-dependent receptor [Parasphingopyxis algicola]
MQIKGSVSLAAIAATFLGAAPAWSQTQPADTATQDQTAQAEDYSPLGQIVVTAQRRDTDLQTTSVAITAFSADTLEDERILSFEDLASRSTSLSFTALSPLDQEFNIRGITNTRLDSPSADQSIGIFVDEVYVGRSGLFNFDLFDIARVEVIRGPQGVLLGRNVVGGAISIITAEPEQTPGGSFTFSYGNFDEVLARGHVTGGLSDTVSARLSFQTRNRDGYNRDILHGRDLDDIQSVQLRGQLLHEGAEGFTARLIVDYTNDQSNGFHSVAINAPDPTTQGPWSAAREAVSAALGRPLRIRESLPEHPLYTGDANETPQELDREAWGITLQLSKEFDGFATLESVTGYRHGDAFNLYDQTGIGPDNGFGVLTPTLFTFPVNETEEIDQFSQEIRLVSDPVPQGFDWIVGAYYQRDEVDKFDRFWAEVPLPVLVTLSGESTWDNSAENETYAVFGQVGYRFNDMWRIVAGVRYTHDSKSGTVTGTAVEGGDQFNPTDTVALTPLAATFSEGESFTASYSDSWSEVTPQATIEFTPNDDLFFYATYSTGFKGGGFEDDPANAVAAQTSYDPETVTSFEVGAKIDFLDRRARLNIAAFILDYQNLQVTQTNQDCLCNITDNAADAEILGVEFEAQFAVTDNFILFGGATFLETEYIDFVDSLGRDASGNFLQRTPDYQFNIGGDLSVDIGDWEDALTFHVNYTHRGKMFWAPENVNFEEDYGLLDGRISFTPNNGDWVFSVYGRNITNELYRTNIIPFFGDEVSRLGAPRTYGAELRVRF